MRTKYKWDLSGGVSGIESMGQCRRHRRCGFDPWVGKSSWSEKWQPNSVFLPGKFQGWRSPVGYSPWGCKEWNTTEHHWCVLIIWMTKYMFFLINHNITPHILYFCTNLSIMSASSFAACYCLANPVNGVSKARHRSYSLSLVLP